MGKQSYTVREALKLAIHYNRIAQDTGNREVVCNTREFIMYHWPMRHTPNNVVMLGQR